MIPVRSQDDITYKYDKTTFFCPRWKYTIPINDDAGRRRDRRIKVHCPSPLFSLFSRTVRCPVCRYQCRVGIRATTRLFEYNMSRWHANIRLLVTFTTRFPLTHARTPAPTRVARPLSRRHDFSRKSQYYIIPRSAANTVSIFCTTTGRRDQSHGARYNTWLIRFYRITVRFQCMYYARVRRCRRCMYALQMWNI